MEHFFDVFPALQKVRSIFEKLCFFVVSLQLGES